MEKQLVPKLRFPEFESKWSTNKIGDYYENLRTGMTPYRGKPYYYEGNIPWITSGELNYNRITETRETISELALKETNLKLYPEGTLFIAITGLEAPGTRGRCAINNVPSTTNQSCLALEKIPEIETVFLYYWYLKYGEWLYSQYAQGTKQQSFNNKIVEKFEFVHPILPEQQKIASFLTDVDESITKLTKKAALLEQYKKGVMQKIFSQELRFKPDDGNEFPDWEENTLKELGETLNGLTGKTKENFGSGKPYIQYKQIFDSSKINIQNCGFVEISESDNQTKVRYGDVFFTTSSETPNEIGTSSVLLDEVNEMYLNSFCFGFRINQLALNPSFSQFLFRSPNFRKKLIPLAQGSTRYNISKSSFLKLKVYLPCIEEQNKIANFLSDIDKKIEAINTKIEKAKTFKKGLLQQMFV
jgi:type I restriction enzyme S subunit